MSDTRPGRAPAHPSPGPLPPERPAAPPQAGGTAPAPGTGDAGTGRADRPAARPSPGGGRRRRESPLIAPGLLPAALTAGLAGLLALTAPLPRPVTACAVVLLQALTAAGWYRLNGMWPARQGIALAFLSGVATDAALLATDRGQAPTVMLATLGVWCVLVPALQLRNHASPDERLYALTAALAASALTVLAAGHLAAVPWSAATLTVGAAAVAAATLVRALPLPPFAGPAAALLAAAGAGYATGLPAGSAGDEGALTGLAAGACALLGLRVASYDRPSRFVHLTAGVALPLTLAAPAVYVLGRALS
ncbi:hypothetical protein HOY81_13810 [Streptomyces sp. JJ36]|nr:hypothetical protein [Streptomyces sp. JJ36]